MLTQRIEHTDLVVSRLSYGCMRIAGTWDPKEITPAREASGHEALLAAYESGYTLFDHADIYAQGGCESVHGSLLKKVPSMRNEIVIATKCGIRFGGDPNPDSPHRFDFSEAHILASCDRSLSRLGIETIDIYQLHRPDLLMDPAEVASAFDKLYRAGKVRYFGISNFQPSFVTALQSALPWRLVVNQVEIHLGRLAPLQDGTLDQCLSDKITPLAWSPLGGGWLGDGNTSLNAKRAHIQQVLDTLALKYGVSRTSMALAWLLRHPSKIVPIVGSTKPEKIRDAVAATEFELDREDWYRLHVAALGEGLP